ncbi:hypothetical protein KAR91_35740, partial [Candidatus Pacearchaeota archaeon]|nr:hypothetical protein [Candidatus Pacearchaeota archaeon]
DKVFPIKEIERERELEPIDHIDWRCLRYGPISGRYQGLMTEPYSGKHSLDLRVDIDSRHANSPVLGKVSGDLYQVYTFKLWKKAYSWSVYKGSWVVDEPTVICNKCSVTVKGKVRYYKGYHLATHVEINIPFMRYSMGPADVKFTYRSRRLMRFSCKKKSLAFRDVKLEVDVCDSVNNPPILPVYDTNTHPDQPAGLPGRTLTIEESYMEAGIDITINPNRTIIDDSAANFNTWSDAELHDAMETHFSAYPGSWPKWQLWGLLAGSYDLSGVAGIMFDYSDTRQRQGFAVFRNHWWLNDLVPNPTTNDELAAMRIFLYLYVHEAGHAFNFMHSWDKGRPDALSWMNYDWKWDDRNSPETFWENFWFEFDEPELIHIRHGDRSSVIMGGDAWSTGTHLESPDVSISDMVGDCPVELLLRSKEFFEFMEPVNLELRIRNTSEVTLNMDTQLNPEYGGVIIHIQGPDGRTSTYHPVMCKIATIELKVLKPKGEGDPGEDRFSQNVPLSYGARGHIFNMPGTYQIKALYQGAGNALIPSNVHRIRIGNPLTVQDEKLAKDFFTYEAGTAMYLNGSSSPFLKDGMDVLEKMTSVYEESPVGANISLMLAKNLGRPFYRLTDGKMTEFRGADPNAAIALLNTAAKQHERDDSTFQNLAYHDLTRTKASMLAVLGKKKEAKTEIGDLVAYLQSRQVNKSVLDEIEKFAKTL